MTVNGKVKVMTETFPLDDAADAYEKTASGKVRFCAVYSLSPILEVFFAESLWVRLFKKKSSENGPNVIYNQNKKEIG
jgi:hypothetical protein